MMNIKNHGEWFTYRPNPIPKEAPSNALFCSNKSGVDWYIYSRNKANFSNNSIKMTVMMDNNGAGPDGVVMAANKDVSFLFPQHLHVIEVFGVDSSDPQAEYGRKIFHSATGTFSDDPAPIEPLPEIQHPAPQEPEVFIITDDSGNSNVDVVKF